MQPGVSQNRWQTVLFLVFSSLGVLLGLGAAFLLGLLGLLALLDDTYGAAQQALGLLVLAWAGVFVALLCLPGVVHNLAAWRGQFRPARPLGRSLSAATLGMGAWVLVLLLIAALQSTSLAWLWLPPLVIPAAGLPLFWALQVGGRGLALEREADLWGVVSTSLIITMPLVLMAEVGVFLVLALGAAAWMIAQPDLAQQWLETLRSLNETVDPRVLQAYLQDWLARPEVIGVLLLVVAGIIPLIEELLKPLALWFFAPRRPTPAQGFLIGLIAGACFALLETMSAFSGTVALQDSLPTLLARVGTGLLHMTTSSLLGWSLAAAWNGRSLWRVLLAYLLAVGLHGLWNTFGLLMGITTAIPIPENAVPQLARLGNLAPLVLGLFTTFNLVFLITANTHLRRQSMTITARENAAP